MKNKPREWWIVRDSDESGYASIIALTKKEAEFYFAEHARTNEGGAEEIIKPGKIKGVHVVEYSAFDKLKTENERLESALELTHVKLDAARATYDRLEACCEKLAGEVQCREKGEFGVPCSAGWPNNPGDWCRCCKALAEYRAMRDETKMPCPDKDIDPLG